MSQLSEYNCSPDVAMQWRAIGYSAAQANEAMGLGLSPWNVMSAPPQRNEPAQRVPVEWDRKMSKLGREEY